MFKEILWGVIILVVALFIFSYLFDSGVRSQTNQFFSDAKATVTKKTEQVFEPEKTNPFYDACMTKVNQMVNIFKMKIPESASATIIESKHFTNRSRYDAYLEMWNFGLLSGNKYTRLDLYKEEGEEWTLAILKIENHDVGQKVAMTFPLLCVDGELTEQSKRLFMF